MSVLPDDQINSVINCLTAKSTWDDLILYHEDFQDSPDDEEDIRSSQEYLNDLEEEYQARALLDKSKMFFRKGTQRFRSAKATGQTECHKCGKKGHFARDYKEEVSSDDNEMVDVKVLMALAEDNDVSSKEGAKNGDWVKISMRKVHTLLEIEDNDDRKNYLEYLYINLNYAEEQRNNLMILLAESQRNKNDPLVVVTGSSVTNYDSADESSVCSTPLPSLKKLDGVEPVS
ncbi:retrovirus-related pol polyprotein from transposon TNT 1-94 [Tanacetum coccineum]|uniref:Retrovirus-related pol polyprotein from transposon TNT 1-94 n=1 Tax=Tanacetum coccineum TaxID=301880 RepID=A0ABQ4WNG4_9ASTR